MGRKPSKEGIFDKTDVITSLTLFQYVPQVEDMVIGRVEDKHSENVKVDLGGAAPATLPMLAFEGATRKNRPNLQVLYRFIPRTNKHQPTAGREYCLRPCHCRQQRYGA